MEQMGNVNNRYVWTDGEIKLFLALIQATNITAFLDGKPQLNSTIYLRERACYQKDARSPGMCGFPLQPLDGNAPNSNFFFANILKIHFTF